MNFRGPEAEIWANMLHSLKRAWSLLNIGEILFATRRCEKEKSKISAQYKVGNFSPRIKCRSFQNRLAIFSFSRWTEANTRRERREERFFSVRPEKVSHWSWSRVSTVGQQGSIYAAIVEGNYLEIQPNLTLLLPLSERDKISNRKTTNRKTKIFFWPFFELWKNYNSSLRDFFMWPSKFYQRCCKHLNLPAICLSCLLRIEYLSFFFFFFFRGHGNESCNLIGSSPGQYFSISAHWPR